MALQTTYCFISPFPTEDTIHNISVAFNHVGKVKKTDPVRGYMLCMYHVGPLNDRKVEFFVERNDEKCNVRACFWGDVITSGKDKWWDNFLKALFANCPNADFGVSLANKDAYIVGVLYLGDETHQVHTSRTTGGTSLLGFLTGGALFGAAGAIVGGMSGKQRTVGHSFEQFSNSQLARVIYNNGRLWEGTVQKGSQLYNEIMVNM